MGRFSTKLSEADLFSLRSVETDETYPFPGHVALEYCEVCGAGLYRLALVDLRWQWNQEVLDCVFYPFSLPAHEGVKRFKESLKEAGVY